MRSIHFIQGDGMVSDLPSGQVVRQWWSDEMQCPVVEILEYERDTFGDNRQPIEGRTDRR